MKNYELDFYIPCQKQYGLFFNKLKDEYNWKSEQANNAILEYQKFLLIVKKYGANQTPSKLVDKVWHIHLLFTKDYWENLCPNYLGFNLHHIPSETDSESKVKDLENYKNTMEHYKLLFGEKNKIAIPDNTRKYKLINSNSILTTLIIFLTISIGSPRFYFLPSVNGEEFLLIYGFAYMILCSVTAILNKDSSVKFYSTRNGIVLNLLFLLLLFIGGLRLYHASVHDKPFENLIIEIIAGSLCFIRLSFDYFFSSIRNNSDNNYSSSCSSSASSCGSSCSSGCGGCGGGD